MNYQIEIIKDDTDPMFLNYQVICEGFAGHCSLQVTKLNRDQLREYRKIYPDLSENDKVAYLKEFYPNGMPSDPGTEKRIKRGVGSVVLNKILEDCKKEGISLIWTIADNPGMITFCSKKQFKPGVYTLAGNQEFITKI